MLKSRQSSQTTRLKKHDCLCGLADNHAFDSNAVHQVLPNGERASDNWDLCAKDYEAVQKRSPAGDSHFGDSVVYEMIPVARDRCGRCVYL